MRELSFVIPSDRRAELEAVLRRNEASALRAWDGDHRSYVDASLPNRRVGSLLSEVEDLDCDLEVTLAGTDVIVLEGGEDPTSSLSELTHLSPTEVYLAGVHSFGSWTSFLSYSAASGAIVWSGLFLGEVPILIAAMLIAPFGGAAMNAALASARGDGHHLRSSVGRYAAALLVAGAVAGLLHAIIGRSVVTDAMATTANVSSFAILLPLVGGAAGALNLMQSERSSLVSATATGMIIAAALAPPVGVVGMAAVAGEWSMVRSGLFLLALQLTVIDLTGSVVFAVYGLSPSTPGLARGNRVVRWSSWTFSVVAAIGLLSWQFASPPSLQRASVQEEAVRIATRELEQIDDVRPVEVDARFTRPDVAGQDTLLVVVFVEVDGGAGSSELEDDISRRVAARIEQSHDVTALVSATTLSPTPRS